MIIDEPDVIQGIPPLPVEAQGGAIAPSGATAPTAPDTSSDRDTNTPWADFNAKADFPTLLYRNGWKPCGTASDEKQQWTRPGKGGGISGTHYRQTNVFNCMTSNAPPLTEWTGYDAWGFYVRYEHGGDFKKAGREYRKQMPNQNYSNTHAQSNNDGASVATLPEFEDVAAMLANPMERPPELIEGICFTGSKISLSSNSKGKKTFAQQHLGVCIATGTEWLGRKCAKGRVLYVNLELRQYSFQKRLLDICAKLGVEIQPNAFHVWNLRGRKITIETLERELFQRVKSGDYALIIFDPLYKILGARSENDASEMADLLNRLESIADLAGAAYIVAHHFAKGNASGKSVIDRSSGSGVVGRDGDCIITLTEHEENDCVAFEAIVRDFPPVPAIGLRWIYPTFEVDGNVNPAALKKAGPARVELTDADVMPAITSTPQTRDEIIKTVMTRCVVGIGKASKAVSVCILRPEVLQNSSPRGNAKPLVRYYVRS